MAPTRFARAAALAAACALVVAGCGDDDDTTTATGGPPTTETAPAAETTAPPEQADDPAEADEAEAPAPATVPDADQTIEVAVAGGQVEGGGRHRVPVGDRVAIVVTSDVAEEIHVHGYDVYADVEAGGSVTLVVDATIPGVWEVELHGSHVKLLELEVR